MNDHFNVPNSFIREIKDTIEIESQDYFEIDVPKMEEKIFYNRQKETFEINFEIDQDVQRSMHG